MTRRLSLPRSRHWAGLAAGAVLLSLATVTLFVGAIGGVGLLVDAEGLWDENYVSITDCSVQDGGRSAASLFWVQPAHGPGWKTHLGVHDLGSRQPVVRIPWPEIHPACLARSPIDDRLFLAGRDGAIYAARVAKPDAPPVLIGRHVERDAVGLECSADGRFLVSLGPCSLNAWDLESGELAWRRDDIDAVNCFAIDSRRQSVVCGLLSGELAEIDISSGRTIRSVLRPQWTVLEINISADGHRLACVGSGGQILLLNWPAATPAWQNECFPRHSAAARLALFSPCGKLLITPAQENMRTLAIWNAETGQRLGELVGHTKPVCGAMFADDGRLYSWGTDGTIRSWDVHQRTALDVISLSVPPQPS